MRTPPRVRFGRRLFILRLPPRRVDHYHAPHFVTDPEPAGRARRAGDGVWHSEKTGGRTDTIRAKKRP